MALPDRPSAGLTRLALAHRLLRGLEGMRAHTHIHTQKVLVHTMDACNAHKALPLKHCQRLCALTSGAGEGGRVLMTDTYDAWLPSGGTT